MSDHLDRIPGAMFGAQRAADATGQIHFDHLLHLCVLSPRNDLDAINRTKDNANLAARTAVLIDDGELWGRFFARRLLRALVLSFFGFLIGIGVLEVIIGHVYYYNLEENPVKK